MVSRLLNRIRSLFSVPLSLYRRDGSPHRYKQLRRYMAAIMLLITIIPLLLMAVINYHEYQKALRSEIILPLGTLVNKTKHSFELFLAERLSAVSFIASGYSFEELADQNALNRMFRVVKNEFGGFIDLGLIDSSGIQISYAGPYRLKGKQYTGQHWLQEVIVKGEHISDVFLGYRKFPHLVIVVQKELDTGDSWVLRATIDTERFDNLIASMGLDPASDAFIVNREGVLQTSSRFYGKVLEPLPFPLPPLSYESNILETKDHMGRDIFLAYAYFVSPSYVLMLIKPQSQVLKSWYGLKAEILLIFLFSVIAIVFVVLKLTNTMVKRIQASDEECDATFHQIEHTNKLASIGRLAAGVAHEINNPMAIINEKAGLMGDIIHSMPSFDNKEKFLSLTKHILESVDRCSTITHRLLGFARRMDVEMERLDLNGVIMEVLGFLEKDAFHRSIEIDLQLDERLSQIESDRGQLQQVFLNILNNAFAAVDDGGRISIVSREIDTDMIEVTITDNGVGMSEDTLGHIFDPFFSTRKGYGTGLGLSITYGIIQKIGGDIQVTSKEGEGAVFTIYLPKTAQ